MGIIERTIDSICLIGSFVLLFLLPQDTGFLFYLLFGISAFLFCIGFFRLIATFSEPASPEGRRLVGLIFLTAGAVLNACGLYSVYSGHGSGRSITIATITLIEAMVFYAMAGGLTGNPAWKRAITKGYRTAAVLLIVLGAFVVIRDGFRSGTIPFGTMLLIEAICLWNIKYETTRFKGKDAESS